MEEKKPLKTKIRKNIEVKPSIEIQIQKQKKILNLIWHWHVTAPPKFPPVREFIFIPNIYCFFFLCNANKNVRKTWMLQFLANKIDCLNKHV